MFGSIEAGGTKFICAVADDELKPIDRVKIDTRNPEDTLRDVNEFFKKYKDDLEAIAVGSFGPIDVDPSSKDYGRILNTPKESWRGYSILDGLREEFDVKIFITTDVNASAYGEYVYGAGKGKDSLVYYTVGTGVGGGAIQNGKFIGGVSHPEMGHMVLKPHPDDDFKGVCPSHGDCLEGLASGPAIEKRLGKKAETLSPDDDFWDIEAYYIAQCAYNTALVFNPEVIVFGGGVMRVPGLIEKVRANFDKLMNGYLEGFDTDKLIVLPAYEGESASLGLFKLAASL